MSVLETRPKFLYPRSRQFPFDEVAEKIVRAIEKRNWKVPGITLEFDTYGSGEAKYQLVRTIIGDNFKLYFCRIQGRLSHRYNDTAALHSVCIPKQILEVFSDESGPTYYLYVGKNWDSDKDWFMKSTKVHSKLDQKPRRYLKYKGDTPRKRSKNLIAYSDLGREYSPEGDEPISINLEQKFKEFAEWLEEHVLNYVLSFPEADTIQPPIPMEELIPYEGPWHTIYSIVADGDDEYRIEQGKSDPSKLLPEERHARFGRMLRLVPLDVRRNDRFPEVAYEGFIWCDVNQNVTPGAKLLYDVRQAMGSSGRGDKCNIAITLKYANHVYVADNSAYTQTREQLFEDIAPRDHLTDKELGDVYAARGATIVPITEYQGDYKEPIVLIGRELEFEEVELLDSEN